MERQSSTLLCRTWEESKKSWHIAAPAMLTSVFQFSIGFATVVFAGYLSVVPLSVSHNVIEGFAFGIMLGMGSALETLCGQAVNAGQLHILGIYLQRSWIITFVTAAALTPLYVFTGPILRLLRQPNDISRVAGELSVWVIPRLYSYAVNFPLQKFFQAHRKVWAIAIIFGAVLGVHVLLSWLFVVKFSRGLMAAAMVGNFSWWLVNLAQMLYLLSESFPDSWTGFSFLAFHNLASFVKISLSSAVMLCLELWYYSAVIILAGYLSNQDVAIAAISICMNYQIWTLMIALGFCIAVRTGSMEVVIASSPVDAGISCWDLRSGSEQLRHRTCSSAPHGLLLVAGRFIASSQLRDSPSAASSPIFFWSWDKPQVEVRSFPAEPIGPLVSNSEGTYIMGGGPLGNIYLWEVASGKLLNKWRAHYRSVTCLTLSSDESLLISGSEDGAVRVWCLLMMFDDTALAAASERFRYSFNEHALPVTDLISGHGLCNSIIISSSEDRTCKIWSLSEGKLLRSVTFPSIIDAITMDPGEHVFYAGGRDGKIYIAALNAERNPNSAFGMFIIGTLYDNRKAITCLAISTDGVTLVSGSEDGALRVWDTRTKHVNRVLKHAKGPINNVAIVRQPLNKKHLHFSLPPPLSKYIDSTDGEVNAKTVLLPQSASQDPLDRRFCSSYVMEKQIKELQKQNTSGIAEMELDRLKLEFKRSSQLVQHWKKLYQDLQSLYACELNDEPR